MTFKRLSEYFQQLEQNSSRIKITEILSDLFKEAKADEIDKICYLSLGRLVPAYQGLEFQMAQKMLEKAISKAFEVESAKVAREMRDLGDLGTTGEKLKVQSSKFKVQRLFGENREVENIGVIDVYEKLMEIAKEAGAGSVERKIDKMAVLLQDLDELSVRYVVRMPLGRMRLGFSEMTLLDSFSWMLKADKSLRVKLEAIYNVVADIGEVAKRVKSIKGKEKLKNIDKVEPKIGTPIMPALCQRIGTAEEIIEKLGEIAVEPKYDGTRLQVHFRRSEENSSEADLIRIFTRNLENVTQMFPEISEALKSEINAKEAIFDGEGLGVDIKTGKFVPFQETIKRKRKHDILQTSKEIPILYFIFDILVKDGQSLITEPLQKRRQILEETLSPVGRTIKLSPQIVTNEPKELRAYHERQIAKGLEGIVAKKWQSGYEPGRRGFHWVKLKQESTKKGGGLADTLDCVVMGIYRGKGKRTDFGVGSFLVGIRKNEKFVTISKIGTGLTDDQFRQLKVQSSKYKTKDKPQNYEVAKNLIPDFWCEPSLVVEIQADNITESPLHTAGMALRFPRLIRFRDDKKADQITTMSELTDLFEMQKGL